MCEIDGWLEIACVVRCREIILNVIYIVWVSFYTGDIKNLNM